VSWCGLSTVMPCAAGVEEDGGEEMWVNARDLALELEE
jgi:hypothetical protein